MICQYDSTEKLSSLVCEIKKENGQNGFGLYRRHLHLLFIIGFNCQTTAAG